jgi:hypothetical protein
MRGIEQSQKMSRKVVVEQSALVLCIRKIPGSNLGSQIRYIPEDFYGLPQSLPQGAEAVL